MNYFAKKQLQKYGWKEGKGLGKNEDGITEPLKPKLKFNTTGIGYKETVTDEWWKTAFDNAVKKINVKPHDDGISLSVVDNSASSKDEDFKVQSKYGNFLKTSILHDGHIVQDTKSTKLEEKEPSKISESAKQQALLTDQEVFNACDGRTACSIARYSIVEKGKLRRLAIQDMMLLGASTSGTTQLKSNSINESIMAHRNTNVESDVEDESENKINVLQSEVDMSSHNLSKSTIKRQKKKMKHLVKQLGTCSINENDKHTKYNTLNHNEFDHGKKKKEKLVAIGSSVYRKNKKEKNQVEKSIPHDKHVNKRKRTSDYKYLPEVHCCASNETRKDTLVKKTESQDKCPMVVIHIETDDVPFSKPKRCKRSHKTIDQPNYQEKDISSDEEICKVFNKQKKASHCEDKKCKKVDSHKKYHSHCKHLASNDLFDMPPKKYKMMNLMLKRLNNKIRKKKVKHSKKVECRQYSKYNVEDIIQNLKKVHNRHNLDAIVNGLMEINLTENVSTKISKKATQTHLTPV